MTSPFDTFLSESHSFLEDVHGRTVSYRSFFPSTGQCTPKTITPIAVEEDPDSVITEGAPRSLTLTISKSDIAIVIEDEDTIVIAGVEYRVARAFPKPGLNWDIRCVR